ncbi:VanW family protein [Sporosarcina aquimarina]|uniref:VanW family protein n=1 Tax=Sporosarcina aquimarina TaxID=114975 RepID=UPI001C8E0606|nr:VanW family protein [Sporosarcina aquimarina]MBY0222514.1 VanW family protein [Sporosarcina aquimarina]
MKRKLYTISLLWAAVLLALSTLFVQDTYAGDGFFSNIKRFGKHTYVGPFDISKLSRKKAKEKLAADFTDLEQNLAVELLVQDESVEVPSEVVTFDVDSTLSQAASGQDNSLIASVSRDGLRTVLKQNFDSLVFSEDEVDTVATKIEEYVCSGIMPQRIHLPEYVPNLYSQTQTLASSTYSINELSKELRLIMEDLNGTEIQPNTTLSFMEILEGKESASASDEQLTIMASMLYTAALQTNWIIDERNISSELTAEVQPGFEAAINRQLGLDFMFSNPNQTVFTIHTNWTNSQLELTIEGLSFVRTYEPEVEKLTTYEPKTVIRYSAFVSPGSVETLEVGKKGLEATVKRKVLLNGSLEEYEDVSVDFYVPQPRIERHHLVQAEKPSDGTNQDGNSSSGPNSANPDSSGSDNTSKNPRNSENNTTGTGTSSGKPSGNSNASEGSAGGKEDDKIIYDKGGNIMKFDENGNPID